jgi:hypothetical protein
LVQFAINRVNRYGALASRDEAGSHLKQPVGRKTLLSPRRLSKGTREMAFPPHHSQLRRSEE